MKVEAPAPWRAISAAFQNVLERPDLEAELVGDADEHQDFVGAVTVRVDEALAFEYLDEGLKL